MASSIQNENESPWITSRRFAILLAVLTFVSWPGIFLGWQTFIYRDFGYFSTPLAYHLRESFWRMELPLWNPLNNCGQPFLAEWNTQALYPPALFYLLLPFPWSLNVFCLLHLFLGGLGMFFLARYWTQSSFGAAVAGIIFAFNGLSLSSLLWPATISALGWMPWVVWLTKRAWREDGRIFVVAVIIGALQMLTGGVEVVILTWALLGTIVLAEFISGDLPRMKIFMRFSTAVLLITCLCAAQLLPFFDLLSHSQRQGNYFAEESPIPPTGWVNLLVPLFRCEQSQGIFFQSGQYWILSYYAGAITVALAVLAVCWRHRQAWLLGILTVFCIVLAMGNSTPIYPWFNSHIPVIGFIRFPAKFMILPVFALPLMAACALAGRQGGPAEQKKIRPANPWLLLWLVTVAVIAICLVWEFHLQPSHDDHAPVLLNGLVRIILFTAIVLCLFVLERTVQFKWRRWLQMAALLLVWLDLDRHEPRPPAVNSAVLQPNMSRSTRSPQFGTSRAFIPPDVLNTLTFAVQPDAAQNFLSHRFALFSDCNLLDDIPKCDGFFPLDLGEHALLYGNLDGPMLDFLGVSEAVVIHSNALDWTTRSTSMPLLTGGQKPIFADDAATLAALAGAHFNPRTEVYLLPEARDMVTATNVATAQISAEKFSDPEIEADVDAGAPTMLVAAQSYYHPWRAYVDGGEVPLFRANYAFQAIAIPQGKHHVRLIYEDRVFEIGAVISIATLLGCVVYYVQLRRCSQSS